MEKAIKIIFFDIDGTLVDMQAKKISPKTVETLQRLKAKGLKICIATGRSPICLPKFEGVEFDAWLTFNGSCCYDQSGSIFTNPLCPEDVQKIIRNAAKLGRPVSVATRDRLASNGIDEDLKDYFSLAHLELTVADDFQQVSREKIYQIMLGCREPDHAAIVEGTRRAKIVTSWDRAGDIIPSDSGKGTGIRKILEHYRLTPEEAMAFGDGNNDIEMLQTVGTGIAMENASPRLKAVADDVCGHVAEDGIYHYCIEKGLI